MPTKTEILEALQYGVFHRSNPIHRTGPPAYEITYQFAGSEQPDDLPVEGRFWGWMSWSSAERDRFRSALDHIESIVNLRFVEVSGARDPDINVGKVTLPAGVAGNGGYTVSYVGDEIVDWDGFAVFDNLFDLMSEPLGIILHELGHALGLSHAHESELLEGIFETTKYATMSYLANPETGVIGNGLMLYDILALQDIWGAAVAQEGDTVYGAPSGGVTTIWDSGGKDTFDASDALWSVSLDLREGAFSRFGTYEDMAIAYGTVIENAIGGPFWDEIWGNDAGNVLEGRGGDDCVKAGPGDDILRGGDGDDELVGGFGADVMYGGAGDDVLRGTPGADILRGGVGDDLIRGGGGADDLAGGSGEDVLRGGRGQDALDGGSGADLLTGGAGGDTFVFARGSGRDAITDFGAGADRLELRDLGDISAALAQAREVLDGVLIDFGAGDELYLAGVSLAEIEHVLGG